MFLNNINNSVFQSFVNFLRNAIEESRGILLRRNNDTKVAIGKRRLFRGKKTYILL